MDIPLKNTTTNHRVSNSKSRTLMLGVVRSQAVQLNVRADLAVYVRV